MNRPAAIACLLALVCAPLPGLVATQSRREPDVIVIQAARVVDVATGRARDVAQVVLRGDRIAALNATPAAVPDGAREIDGHGLTLVPGFVDLSVQAMPATDLDPDFQYALSLAHGVTTVRAVDARLRWTVTQRERVRAGDLVAPRLWVSGPSLSLRTAADADGVASVLPTGLEPATVAADATGAAREAERQVAAKVDWIRVRPEAGPDVLRAIVAAARGTGVRVSAGARATAMVQFAQLGVALVDGLGMPARSLAEYQLAARRPDMPREPNAAVDYVWEHALPAEIRSAADRLARSRVALAPMLRVAGEATLDPKQPPLAAELALLPARTRDAIEPRLRPADPHAVAAWKAKLAFVGAFAKAGGRLVTASGARATGWPAAGRGLAAEMTLLVTEAGLSPADALRAATLAGAEVLGAGDQLGQVKVGWRADLVGLRGDPLADITQVDAVALVIRGGEVLDRESLLKQAQRAAGGRVK